MLPFPWICQLTGQAQCRGVSLDLLWPTSVIDQFLVKHEIGKRRMWFELISPERTLLPGGCWKNKSGLAPHSHTHLSLCTANYLITWTLPFATRGNYPHENSPCRLQCRCEKFHKRLVWWPTVRDKGFYLKVSRAILILGLLQTFNPNSSTPAELVETFFFLPPKTTCSIWLQEFIHWFLYFAYTILQVYI